MRENERLAGLLIGQQMAAKTFAENATRVVEALDAAERRGIEQSIALLAEPTHDELSCFSGNHWRSYWTIILQGLLAKNGAKPESPAPSEEQEVS